MRALVGSAPKVQGAARWRNENTGMAQKEACVCDGGRRGVQGWLREALIGSGSK